MVTTTLPPTLRARTERELTMRIQAEYDEMPGLCLTARQARRLWGIDRELCALGLNALLEQGFLRRTHDGLYVRARH